MTARRNTRLGCAVSAALALGLLFVAVPKYLEALRRSHFKRCLGDMRAIGIGLEAYARVNGSYPALGGRRPVEALRPYLEPTYIQALPTTDFWNKPLLYVGTRDQYEVWSLGSDGREGPNVTDGPTEGWEADIVLRNGTFVRFPAFVRGAT